MTVNADIAREARPVLGPLLRGAGLERLEQLAATRFVPLTGWVLALAFAARVIVALVFPNIDPQTANVWEYGRIAAATLQHGAIFDQLIPPDGPPFSFPTAFVPPLLIFLWIPVVWLFGISKLALATMIGINIGCGTLVCFYTIRIAKLLLQSSLAALAAGTIIAVHPVFVFSANTFHAVNLYGALFLPMFYVSCSQERPTWTRAFGIGVLWGAAILARTEYLVLGGAIVLGTLWTQRRPLMFAVTVLTAMAIVVPWTARNYVVFHRFIPVTNSFGYNLFKGFNPQANGSGNWVDRKLIAIQMLGERLGQVPVTRDYESETDDIYRQAALTFIREHPVKSFVTLPVRKILLFWFFDVYDPQTRQLLYQLQFWPLFVLTAVGIGWAIRSGLFREPAHRTVALMFAAETLVMAAYAVHARYRMNIEPLLFVYAALGALVIAARLRSNSGDVVDRRETAAPAAADAGTRIAAHTQ